jgi:hypothetical protein
MFPTKPKICNVINKIKYRNAEMNKNTMFCKTININRVCAIFPQSGRTLLRMETKMVPELSEIFNTLNPGSYYNIWKSALCPQSVLMCHAWFLQ